MSEKRARPLSPHLQVYNPQLTSMLSILHRATGVAMVFALMSFVWMLVAAATGAAAYNQFLTFFSGLIGQIALIGWSFCLFYHGFNGIRHLIWDTGRLFVIEHAAKAGLVVFWGAVAVTVAFWALAV